MSDGPNNLDYAISIAVALSDAVIDEIKNAPTYSYFHHYRTVNAYIDRVMLRIGLLLQQNGFRYLPIGASQSMPDLGGANSNSAPSDVNRTHRGRYSHKKAAVLAGLGEIGKSGLFIHRKYGPRVRLGTLFTDCELTEELKIEGQNRIADDFSTEIDNKNRSVAEAKTSGDSVCNTCEICVKACPAVAIKGVLWHPGITREEMFDADACNNYMREHFMKIGRGSVCGICMRVCPQKH